MSDMHESSPSVLQDIWSTVNLGVLASIIHAVAAEFSSSVFKAFKNLITDFFETLADRATKTPSSQERDLHNEWADGMLQFNSPTCN